MVGLDANIFVSAKIDTFNMTAVPDFGWFVLIQSHILSNLMSLNSTVHCDMTVATGLPGDGDLDLEQAIQKRGSQCVGRRNKLGSTSDPKTGVPVCKGLTHRSIELQFACIGMSLCEGEKRGYCIFSKDKTGIYIYIYYDFFLK